MKGPKETLKTKITIAANLRNRERWIWIPPSKNRNRTARSGIRRRERLRYPKTKETKLRVKRSGLVFGHKNLFCVFTNKKIDDI